MARRTRAKKQVERITIGYVRCSTDEQATTGTSIDSQTQRIEQYAAAMGLEVSQMVSDPGWSAKTLLRPGIGQIIEAVKRGEVETVIVLKLDRITRSLADLQALLALFDRHDVRLLSVAEVLDTRSAAGKMLINILGTFAQFEREQTSERTSLGLATKRRNGTAYGRVPFGYRRIDNTLVPYAPEQAALAQVRRMFDEGVSYARIAAWLDDNGHKPPQGGTKWHATSVRKLCLSKAFSEGVGEVA